MENGTYEGVKFHADRVNELMPDLDRRIEELILWCKKFHDLGLAPPYEGGSFGNLSYRVAEGQDKFIITGSRIGLKGALSEGAFSEVVKCDTDREILRFCGKKEPSSESLLHYEIYRKRKDVNAVFHGHCPEILSCAEKLGLMTTKNRVPYGTKELAEEVLRILDDHPFIVIKDHGFISLGWTMKEAGETAVNIFRRCEYHES